MPASMAELERSLDGVSPALMNRVGTVLQAGDRPFREIVDAALELLGGVVPTWPLLSEWNRWCLANKVSFFVWQPRQEGLTERQRLEALVHTLMMLAAKERNAATFQASHIAEVEVVMAGDDCVVCDGHRHRVVPLSPSAMDQLAPFHPGCRCSMLPRFA